MKLNSFFLVFFQSLILIFAACNSKKPNSPNIIYIMADDLGYGDLGAYGQTQIKTPVLDKIAEEGLKFTQHYSGSTVCAPSRCALMTGKHMGFAFIRGNGGPPLRDRDTTIAEILKEVGYKTALCGKWGLGNPGSTGIPTKQGFDYFFGYMNQSRAHNYYPDYLYEDTTKVLLKNEVVYPEGRDPAKSGSASTNKIEYSHDLIAQKALEFVSNNHRNPFFLYWALTIPHANNEARLINKHGQEVPDLGEYADKDWPEPQKGTAAMISRMDADIGRLIDLLIELGIEQNTYIFFTSDNGPHAEGRNDPKFFASSGELRGKKRDLYEGGIRVPFIAWAPGKIYPGVTDHISAFWDFLPTACDIAKIDYSDGNGISYYPTLMQQKQPEHSHLYWEFYERKGAVSIRKGNWKLVVLNTKKEGINNSELYDLSIDIREKNNIAKENIEVLNELKRLIPTSRTIHPDYYSSIDSIMLVNNFTDNN